MRVIKLSNKYNPQKASYQIAAHISRDLVCLALVVFRASNDPSVFTITEEAHLRHYANMPIVSRCEIGTPMRWSFSVIVKTD